MRNNCIEDFIFVDDTPLTIIALTNQKFSVSSSFNGAEHNTLIYTTALIIINENPPSSVKLKITRHALLRTSRIVLLRRITKFNSLYYLVDSS